MVDQSGSAATRRTDRSSSRTGGMLVYNTHIESGDNGRIKRRQVAEILSDQSSHALGLPVVIAGDFNSDPVRGASFFRSLISAAFADALGEVGQRGSYVAWSARSHRLDFREERQVGQWPRGRCPGCLGSLPANRGARTRSACSPRQPLNRRPSVPVWRPPYQS